MTQSEIEDEIQRADWRDFIEPVHGSRCEWTGCGETDPLNLTLNPHKDRNEFFVLCRQHREACLNGDLMDENTVPEGTA